MSTPNSSVIPILYEDLDLLIVEKPVGIPTCLLRGGKKSLEEIVSGQCPSELTACHRLDTDTSGLVVFARNQGTYEKMREAFSKNRVEKEYTALVSGTVTGGNRITWPIGSDPKSKRKVKVFKNLKEARRHKAQEAETVYKVVKAEKNKTLLKIWIKTGVRHQIRAHLAAIGHPIVGDKLYGGPPADRLYLHASRVRFPHPRTGQLIEVVSEPVIET